MLRAVWYATYMFTTTVTEPFTTVLPTPNTACTHPVLTDAESFETDTRIDPEEFMYDSEEDVERGFSTAMWIVESCGVCKRAVLIHYV